MKKKLPPVVPWFIPQLDASIPLLIGHLNAHVTQPSHKDLTFFLNYLDDPDKSQYKYRREDAGRQITSSGVLLMSGKGRPRNQPLFINHDVEPEISPTRFAMPSIPEQIL